MLASVVVSIRRCVPPDLYDRSRFKQVELVEHRKLIESSIPIKLPYPDPLFRHEGEVLYHYGSPRIVLLFYSHVHVRQLLVPDVSSDDHNEMLFPLCIPIAVVEYPIFTRLDRFQTGTICFHFSLLE